MTVTLSSQITAGITWRRIDDDDAPGSLIDTGAVAFDMRPTCGLLPGQACQQWNARGTLASGTNLDLDLTALAVSLFGSSSTRSFGRIKYLQITNLSTTEAATLKVGAAPSNPFAGMFGADDDAIVVPPTGCVLLTNTINGAAVSSADRILRLRATGPVAAEYQIAIIGSEAAYDLPVMLAADDMPNFIYGENGPWDAGACGNQTYVESVDKWKFGIAITWYAFWQESGMDRPFPSPGFNCNAHQTNNDVITGLPTAREIFQGTINRLKAKKPDGLFGFYVSLAQIASLDGLKLLSTIAWPRTRPLWNSEWDAIGASGWRNSDICPGGLDPATCTLGRWTDLESEVAREKQATEVAAIVQDAKEDSPDVNLVFSDNFSVLATDEAYADLMDVAGRFIEKISPLGIALLPNVTTSGMRGPTINGGDLTPRWDALASAGGIGVIGIYQESITNAHAMWTSLFEDYICPNIQNWIRRDWPGGGKRALICLSQPEFDHDPDLVDWGNGRRLVVASAVVINSTTIEFETTTPHYIEDTSMPYFVPEHVHAAVNGGQFIPTVIDETTFRITYTHGQPNGSLSLGTNPWVHFLNAGYDPDFGLMHALREIGDATFNHWNPSTTFGDPKWLNDFATFGQVVPGSLAIVSTHDVIDGNGNTHECVKEFKYQFAQGPSDERWHHVDLSIAGRRRWKAAS